MLSLSLFSFYGGQAVLRPRWPVELTCPVSRPFDLNSFARTTARTALISLLSSPLLSSRSHLHHSINPRSKLSRFLTHSLSPPFYLCRPGVFFSDWIVLAPTATSRPLISPGLFPSHFPAAAPSEPNRKLPLADTQLFRRYALSMT